MATDSIESGKVMSGSVEAGAPGTERLSAPLRWITLTLLFFVMDALTKVAVQVFLTQPHRDITIIPGFFAFSPTVNKGIAFSLLAGTDSVWKPVLLTTVAVAALVWFSWMILDGTIRKTSMLVASGMVCGGILGNTVNRLLTGSVVDFLDFHVGRFAWPTFNIADSCISIGAVWLIISLLREERKS